MFQKKKTGYNGKNSWFTLTKTKEKYEIVFIIYFIYI